MLMIKNSIEVLYFILRPSMVTPFSTNSVSAFHYAGIVEITRIEKSQRYQIRKNNGKFDEKELMKANLFEIFGDLMIECEYKNEPQFDLIHEKQPYKIIELIGINGKNNLIKANNEMGLGFDVEDIDFYLELFQNRLKRNPTDVELFGKIFIHIII